MIVFGIDWKIATIYDIDRIDVNVKDEYDSTPLHFAAGYSNPEIIHALWEKEAEFTTDKERRTPLHFAAGIYLTPQHGENNSNPEIILALMKNYSHHINHINHINLDKSKKCDSTPLHFAARNNSNHKITLALVDNKIHPLLNATPDLLNEEGWTPLHCAAFHNTNPQVIEILLNEGRSYPKRQTTGLGSSNAYELIKSNPALKDDPICEKLRKLCSD